MQFLEELKFRNELLYYFGLICLILSIVCLVLIKLTNIQVLGINAFVKPFKFFISTTIFVWSMAWYAYYLNQPSMVLAYSIGLIVFFTIEDVYIFIQAIRGQTSHFNVTTGYNQMMWSIMAFCAVGISLWTLVLTVSFFSNPLTDLPDYYRWGIRLALIIFVIFSMEGLAMGARMAHTIAAADGSEGLPLVNWSKRYGDLRVAHFLGMHALQIIPLFSFYVLKSNFAIAIFSMIYFLITSLTFVQALNGKSILNFLSSLTK
jgi:hypothetical protein